jgi:hypothetical protein
MDWRIAVIPEVVSNYLNAFWDAVRRTLSGARSGTDKMH